MGTGTKGPREKRERAAKPETDLELVSEDDEEGHGKEEVWGSSKGSSGPIPRVLDVRLSVDQGRFTREQHQRWDRCLRKFKCRDRDEFATSGDEAEEVAQQSRPSKNRKRLRKFKISTVRDEDEPIGAMAFQPKAPYELAVCTGDHVYLYQCSVFGECEKQHTVQRLHKKEIQCCAYRSDGRLLVYGDKSGTAILVAVDLKQKKLRRFERHGAFVTCCGFSTVEKCLVATGCKDGRFRIWDTFTGNCVVTVYAHVDGVKCLASVPGSTSLWLTGGFDGAVRLWDTQKDGTWRRSPLKKLELEHGAPVEALLFFPAGSIVASIGGHEIRLWDLAGGGRLIRIIGDHSFVTSACLDSTGSVMLTTSLDGTAQIHDTRTFDLLQTYDLPAPAICSTWCPTDVCFAIGMNNNQWLVMGRKKKKVSNLVDAMTVEEKKLYLTPEKMEEIEHGQPNDFKAAVRSKLPQDEDYRRLEPFSGDEINFGESKPLHPEHLFLILFSVVSFAMLVGLKLFRGFHKSAQGLKGPLMLV